MKNLVSVLFVSAVALGAAVPATAATSVVRVAGANASSNSNGPLAALNNPNANNGNAVIPNNGYNPNLGQGCLNSGNVPKKCKPSGS